MHTIPHNRPTIGHAEEEAAAKVIRSGYVTCGPEVQMFEKELAEYLDRDPEHVIAFSSGTAALYVILHCLDLKSKIAALPGYVCGSLLSAVRLAQYHPVFLDTSLDSPNIALENSLNFLQANGAVSIVPHMFGIPASIPVTSDLFVIEDCAQALGAKSNGRMLGSTLDAAIFSFSATKMITSGGQGGAVYVKDRLLADLIRDFRNFDGRHDIMFRFNFLMTDIQAAIGRVQLSRLPQFLNRRESIFQRYQKNGLDLLDAGDSDNTPVRYRSIIRTQHAPTLQKQLESLKIKTIVPIEPAELLCPDSQIPHAARFARTTLSIPTYPSLTDEEVDYISARVQECLI